MAISLTTDQQIVLRNRSATDQNMFNRGTDQQQAAWMTEWEPAFFTTVTTVNPNTGATTTQKYQTTNKYDRNYAKATDLAYYQKTADNSLAARNANLKKIQTAESKLPALGPTSKTITVDGFNFTPTSQGWKQTSIVGPDSYMTSTALTPLATAWASQARVYVDPSAYVQTSTLDPAAAKQYGITGTQVQTVNPNAPNYVRADFLQSAQTATAKIAATNQAQANFKLPDPGSIKPNTYGELKAVSPNGTEYFAVPADPITGTKAQWYQKGTDTNGYPNYTSVGQDLKPTITDAGPVAPLNYGEFGTLQNTVTKNIDTDRINNYIASIPTTTVSTTDLLTGQTFDKVYQTQDKGLNNYASPEDLKFYQQRAAESKTLYEQQQAEKSRQQLALEKQQAENQARIAAERGPEPKYQTIKTTAGDKVIQTDNPNYGNYISPDNFKLWQPPTTSDGVWTMKLPELKSSDMSVTEPIVSPSGITYYPVANLRKAGGAGPGYFDIAWAQTQDPSQVSTFTTSGQLNVSFQRYKTQMGENVRSNLLQQEKDYWIENPYPSDSSVQGVMINGKNMIQNVDPYGAGYAGPRKFGELEQQKQQDIQRQEYYARLQREFEQSRERDFDWSGVGGALADFDKFVNKTVGWKTIATIAGSALGGPLGATFARAAAGAVAGESIEDIAKAAALTFAATYGMQALNSALNETVQLGADQGLIDTGSATDFIESSADFVGPNSSLADFVETGTQSIAQEVLPTQAIAPDVGAELFGPPTELADFVAQPVAPPAPGETIWSDITGQEVDLIRSPDMIQTGGPAGSVTVGPAPAEFDNLLPIEPNYADVPNIDITGVGSTGEVITPGPNVVVPSVPSIPTEALIAAPVVVGGAIAAGGGAGGGGAATTPTTPTPAPQPITPAPVEPIPQPPAPVEPIPQPPTPQPPAPVEPVPVEPPPVVAPPTTPAPVEPIPQPPTPVEPVPIEPPPVTQPPVTQPPVVEPPIVEPPVPVEPVPTQPPAPVEPPVVEPPAPVEPAPVPEKPPVEIIDKSAPYTGEYSNESVLQRYMNKTLTYGDIAKLVAAGLVLPSVLNLIGAGPQMPGPRTYGPLAPIQWGEVGGLSLPGLNPGFLTTPTPFYQTTDPVQSQFYWGMHPYIRTMADIGQYNQVPEAPLVPFGQQQRRQPFDTERFISETIGTPEYQQAAIGGSTQYPGGFAPATSVQPAVTGLTPQAPAPGNFAVQPTAPMSMAAPANQPYQAPVVPQVPQVNMQFTPVTVPTTLPAWAPGMYDINQPVAPYGTTPVPAAT